MSSTDPFSITAENVNDQQNPASSIVIARDACNQDMTIGNKRSKDIVMTAFKVTNAMSG